jgi:predicted negative regulator of RcsB-dependent stress response
MKRKERRKLKTNELSDFLNKVYDLAKKRAKEIGYAIGVIVIVFLVFLVSRYFKARNLQEQSRLLARINEVNQDLDENPQRIDELKDLAGKEKFARMGYIYIARYDIEKGELDKALNSLENIPASKKDIIYYQSQLLKADIYHRKKELDRALEIYQKIEDEKPDYFALDVVLFKKAEIIAEKGDKDKALELYKSLSEDYPQTYYGYESYQKIEQLEGGDQP